MLRGTHDNWEKLVGAVLDREELRRIAYCESLSSCSSPDLSSRFSFHSVAPAASGISGNTLYPASISTDDRAQPIKFKELKKATKSFHHDMWLGRGVFGPVFKGWIDEHTLCASKPGSGMAVAVKKWIQGSMEHEEYLKEINYLSQRRHPKLYTSARYGATGRMTHISTGIVGSNVIIAAEYGKLTEKYDVYSFGSVLLELLSGSRAPHLTWPMQDQLEWAKRYVGDKTKMLQIMDDRLDGQYPHDEAYTVAKLASRCMSSVPEKRPRMAEVVVTLQLLECPHLDS